MDKLTYFELMQSLNQNMLVADTNRVALLRTVLDALDHPEKNYRMIHLAGTNGKGSTGTMIAQTLENAGFKVGHFASPPMNDQKEQITINQQMITNEQFVVTYQKIVAKLPIEITAKDISIFEWFVLIMLQFFADQEVEWAVIEAGLGGLNDATNAIMAPLITIFTHIDYDHLNILGSTLEAIAENKAQIIKSGTTTFVAPSQNQEVIKIIQNTAHQKAAQSPILVEKLSSVLSVSLNGFQLNLKVGTTELKNVHFNLVGEAQLDNLATVIAVYDWLLVNNMVEDPQPLVKMMNEIEIPGRFQVISQQPLTILDGAHNVDGTRQLTTTLLKLRPSARFIFILGFLKDKEYQKMAQLYDQLATQIIVVVPDNQQRALGATATQRLFTSPTTTTSNAITALQQAHQLANDDTVIVVSGSFYLVKELENGWHGNTN